MVLLAVPRFGSAQEPIKVEPAELDAPIEILFARIRQRNMECPPITVDDMVKWSKIFERPSSEEMALFDPPRDHY